MSEDKRLAIMSFWILDPNRHIKGALNISTTPLGAFIGEISTTDIPYETNPGLFIAINGRYDTIESLKADVVRFVSHFGCELSEKYADPNND